MNERGKLYEVHRNRGAGKPVVENHWELEFRLGVFKLIIPPETKVSPPAIHQPAAFVFQDSTQVLSPMLTGQQLLPLVHHGSLSHFSSVQFSHSVMSDSPWTAARQASLSITNSWSLLNFMAIMSVRPSNHLILCRPLLLPPSVFPSIRVFSSESALPIRWPKDWSFSFSFSMFQHQSF